jgi:hypothetical protein
MKAYPLFQEYKPSSPAVSRLYSPPAYRAIEKDSAFVAPFAAVSGDSLDLLNERPSLAQVRVDDVE